MKAILLIIDGLGDEVCSELGDLTPLQAARCHHMTALARRGEFGTLQTCPEGFAPESTICIMSLLGVDKRFYPQGRASLEALACGISFTEGDLLFRCNLVAVDERGRLASFNGGNLTQAEQIRGLEKVWVPEEIMEFVPMSGYRNLVIAKGARTSGLDVKTFPPHDHLGENARALWPLVEGNSEQAQAMSEYLHRFMVMNGSLITSRGLRYGLWVWGQSVMPEWPDFFALHGISGAMVGSIETVRGIGKALKMDVPHIQGGTGDVDTDLGAKLRTGIRLIRDHDFVCIHINGADEAAHRCQGKQKAEFLKKIDEELIGPLADYLSAEKIAHRLLICGDHATRSRDGKHALDPVPFILAQLGGEQENLREKGERQHLKEFLWEKPAGTGVGLTAEEGLGRLIKE